MSKTQKIVLGMITIWPIIYIFIFIASIFSFLFGLQANGTHGSTAMPAFFPVLIIFHILTIFVCLGLLVYYLRHMITNTSIAQDHKTIWIIALFLGNIITILVYYYIQILRDTQIRVTPEISPSTIPSSPQITSPTT